MLKVERKGKEQLAAELRSQSRIPYSVEGFSQSFVTPDLICIPVSQSAPLHSMVHLSIIVTTKSVTKGLRTPCDCQDGQGLDSDIIYMHRYVYLSPPFMPVCSWVLISCQISSTARLSEGSACKLRSNFKDPLLSPSTRINILLIRKVALRPTLLTISQADVNKHLHNSDKMAPTLNQ